MTEPAARRVSPGSWNTPSHFYPRVPNAVLHPLVRALLRLGPERIAERYVHLHPRTRREDVLSVLRHRTQYFRWSGADLLHTTDEHGVRRMIVVETNSSPSGQKSMPVADDDDEAGGYRRLLERSFLPMLSRRGLPKGDLAVLYDKNEMETSGYAAVLADLTGEPVHLVYVDAQASSIRIEDGVIIAHTTEGWRPIRAAFRYVTQRPWKHFPPITRTALLNPVIACLAGGRNKLVAAKAYALYNARHRESGLRIRVPETVAGATREELPLLLERFGGCAAVKIPYGNAGVGVATVTHPSELEALIESSSYDRFLVQALVGNVGWSSTTREGRLYHVGTVPDRQLNMYVADVRMMVGVGPEGFYPLALYARRARSPLKRERPAPGETWDQLGTNLSVRKDDGSFTTEPDRLLLVDGRDFNKLGIGLDELIEAYLQTVMATIAIDDTAVSLVTKKGVFRHRLFGSLVSDPAFIAEVRRA